MAAGIGGAISGFKKMKEGKDMQRKAEQAIAGFEWQDLSNPFRDAQVSTLGSEFRQEMADTATATAMEASRAGGARSIATNVGRVQAQNNRVAADIAANLDQQQADLNLKAAAQDVNNQNMIEKRQADELAGYGKMMDVGMDMRHSGMGDLVAAGGAFDSFLMKGGEMVLSGMTGGMGGGA